MTVGVAVAVAALLASFAGPVGDRPALFASTDDLRAQLTTANTELKGLRETSAATERALAETRAALTAEQTKRQAAEKLVSDIKAVLGIAAPANDAATTPAGAAKAPTPAR
jgi:chromosome segregation ATPase